MKQAILIVVGILLSMQVHAQENLVPNGQFEDNFACPSLDCEPYMVHSCIPNWKTPGYGSPDYYHFCTPEEWGLPTHNVFGGQIPKSGNALIGLYCFAPHQPQGREYIQVKLKEPLHAGVRYIVSFYVSLADMSRYAISSLGVHLSHEPLTQSEYWVIDVEPQIQNPAGNIIADTSGWVLVTDTFKTRAGGGEEWLTIGNFNYAVDSDTLAFQPANPDMGGFFHSYYYIDDVSVVALDSIPNSVTELEEEDDDFLVYPNPTTGAFTIEGAVAQGEVAMLEVFNLMGQMSLSQQLTNGEVHQVDATSLAVGIYTVQITISSKVRYTSKLSVLK